MESSEDKGTIYLEACALGRPAPAARDTLLETFDEWTEGLVGSWSHWLGMAGRIGDRIGSGLLGAAPGSVVLSDSTTVNLYKLTMAAVAARPGRRVIVTDTGNFATDRYVAAGIADRHDLELRQITSDLDHGVSLDDLAKVLDDNVAVVCLSLVDYRSGTLLDMAAVNEIVHAAGALIIWDVSHAVGAVPISLDATGADLAVGCTYKYVGGGPGAPAFLYVRQELHSELLQPIWGWFGQRDQFAMGPAYDPVPGIERFLCGTPPILSLSVVSPAIERLASAGLFAVRKNSLELTDLILERCDLRPASPLEHNRRGPHVTFEHPDAQQIVARLKERGVFVGYVLPNRIRIGPHPLDTTAMEIEEAFERWRAM